MGKVINFPATQRDRAGKGAARATRREGRVPGVIYGNKEEPVLISVDPIELWKQVSQPGFFGHVFEIQVGGTSHRVLPRDLQLDPLSDRPIHVDFMRFSATTRVNVEVVVHFLNEEECPGIRRGGVLNVVRHEVELRCAPDNIPEYLEADLAGLDIGDSIHISAVTLPEGVEPTITDRDFTIATIAAPSAEEDAAESGEAPTASEVPVIGKEAEEGDEKED
jgi:large subunit ribosomal protein L25